MRQKIEEARLERKKFGDRIGNYASGLYNEDQSETEGEERKKTKSPTGKNSLNRIRM